MINGFYTAKSGVAGHQNLLNVSANNLANASTTGYKAQRAAFSDLVYTNLPAPAENEENLLTGHGMKLSSVSTNLEQGIVAQTGNNLDVAILGQGYFCVENLAGERHYTRGGNFKIDNSQGTAYLCTAVGDRVLDENFLPVIVKGDAGEFKLYPPGKGGEAESGINLAIVAFQNPAALMEKGQGLLAANEQTGVGELDYNCQISQGALEYSNVSMVNEMTKMIQAQRGFQFNAKVLQTADEIEAMVNSLRG